MKIFILTEGGLKTGFGHIVRCGSLRAAFRKTGFKPSFIINGDRAAEGLLKKGDYRIFDWLNGRDEIFRVLKNADVVIVDSYLADVDFYRRVSGLAGVPVYIDDYKRLDYPRGIVINAAPYAAGLKYPRNKGVQYLLGPGYAPLREEFRSMPVRVVNKKARNILVSFGGNDAKNMTPKILRFFNKDFPDLRKYVLIGKGFRNMPRIKALENKMTELVYYPDARRMKEAMLECDLAVSAGGQTLHELARAGLATIGICVARNQKLNLEGWKETGFIEYIGWYNSKTLLSRLEKAVDRLLSYGERVKRSRIGMKAVDGRGPQRIVKEIMNSYRQGHLIKLREVREKDSRDLWKWRDHPAARERSFNGGPIKYEDHKKWLRDKIKDKSAAIYMAENSFGEKVGQIRFDMNDKGSVYVSVGLNPDFFGKGLGSRLIKKGTGCFAEANPGAKEFVAEIMDGHIGSENAFKKAGYVFWRRMFKCNRKIAVFKRKR